MLSLSGACHCGALRLQLTLPGDPADYAPRACDCDFCRKHGAAFVSHPTGALRIEAGQADGKDATGERSHDAAAVNQ